MEALAKCWFETSLPITLRFGKLFPFLFVTASQGSEGVICFCSHKGSFDRPVDANASPFKVESSIALAALFQTGKLFRASLLDNDLLFDGNPNKADAYKHYSLALRNALFGVSAPYSLFLSGELKGDNEIAKGVVTLMYGIYQYLPTLPDPYVASYTQLLFGREANQLRGSAWRWWVLSSGQTRRKSNKEDTLQMIRPMSISSSRPLTNRCLTRALTNRR